MVLLCPGTASSSVRNAFMRSDFSDSVQCKTALSQWLRGAAEPWETGTVKVQGCPVPRVRIAHYTSSQSGMKAQQHEDGSPVQPAQSSYWLLSFGNSRGFLHRVSFPWEALVPVTPPPASGFRLAALLKPASQGADVAIHTHAGLWNGSSAADSLNICSVLTFFYYNPSYSYSTVNHRLREPPCGATARLAAGSSPRAAAWDHSVARVSLSYGTSSGSARPPAETSSQQLGHFWGHRQMFQGWQPLGCWALRHLNPGHPEQAVLSTRVKSTQQSHRCCVWGTRMLVKGS